MEDLTTNTTVPSHHHDNYAKENKTILRMWHHNHSLTLPFIIMCVITAVFLCFAQISLMLIKRRLNVLKEVTVTISASQLEELIEKKRERDQNMFTISMPPIRGPPSYSSIDLSDDSQADNSYASHP
ncbi:hypothetical protein PRIPAC_83536 [Pristionchus pacificus]|uniref:Uncharacterized protein n=1 Tax=Pristionchus pacificus TaxID=54126 RepID=A0A454Y479_PRIPA|nr:hypothetical protein PRIPAC_83536 [Pristionchus pacificus]|eukprot:PDM78022.1 hypothetical protein PRIPAC_35211 [Pristionchus pacificus]